MFKRNLSNHTSSISVSTLTRWLRNGWSIEKQGRNNGIPKSEWIVRVLFCGLFLGLACGRSRADFIQVTTSSAAPAGLGAKLVQDISNQYLAQVIKNPLASNTWSIKLFGTNPSFNGPPTTLNQALTLGATVYLYGYRDGAGYDQHVQQNLVGGFALTCSTPMAGIPTWDPGTCQAVTGAISAEIYKQIGSTITVVPGY